LNPLAEGEHNRVFASETQRMMGRAHQVPSLAPKKTSNRMSFFFCVRRTQLHFANFSEQTSFQFYLNFIRIAKSKMKLCSA